ncbi:hypothetical protein NDU88_005085 [Pleurodeles waltl]|uniref:Uncharacterized protein n=1 Tax=Pleurodeles waltl TaxID=8319 RepID=A0AAV7VM71_PLEWA|nr:hypothetical protein NDU88_005085 [Pleurodeles waltl]
MEAVLLVYDVKIFPNLVFYTAPRALKAIEDEKADREEKRASLHGTDSTQKGNLKEAKPYVMIHIIKMSEIRPVLYTMESNFQYVLLMTYDMTEEIKNDGEFRSRHSE